MLRTGRDPLDLAVDAINKMRNRSFAEMKAMQRANPTSYRNIPEYKIEDKITHLLMVALTYLEEARRLEHRL